MEVEGSLLLQNYGVGSFRLFRQQHSECIKCDFETFYLVCRYQTVRNESSRRGIRHHRNDSIKNARCPTRSLRKYAGMFSIRKKMFQTLSRLIEFRCPRRYRLARPNIGQAPHGIPDEEQRREIYVNHGTALDNTQPALSKNTCKGHTSQPFVDWQ